MVQLLKLGERNRKKSPHSLTLFIRIFTYFYILMGCICWFNGAVFFCFFKKDWICLYTLRYSISVHTGYLFALKNLLNITSTSSGTDADQLSSN